MALREGEVSGLGYGRSLAQWAQDDGGGGGRSVTAPALTAGTIGPVLSARGVTNGKGPAPALWNARAWASGANRR